jgi:hypothetical protein
MATMLTNNKIDTSAIGKESVASTEQDHDHSKGALVNASGHVQELDRQFNLVSLAGAGLVTGKNP